MTLDSPQVRDSRSAALAVGAVWAGRSGGAVCRSAFCISQRKAVNNLFVLADTRLTLILP